MTDQELDSLLLQSAQNQRVVESINRQVMKTVRRDMRLKVLRKWAKLLGLCFGLPLLAVVYIYMLFTYMPAMEQVVRIVVLVLPLGTLAVFFAKELRNFSIFDL